MGEGRKIFQRSLSRRWRENLCLYIYMGKNSCKLDEIRYSLAFFQFWFSLGLVSGPVIAALFYGN